MTTRVRAKRVAFGPPSILLRLVAALLAGVALVFAGASGATAHAELEQTSPLDGATVAQSPDHIRLTFGEPVEIALGAVRVFDAAGDRQTTGNATHPDGDSRSVQITTDTLPEGTYVVSWRVISADTHPVQGAFRFQVGNGAVADTSGLTAQLLASSGGSAVVGGIFAGVRFLAFVALTVFTGGLFILALVWPTAWASSRVRSILWISWGFAVATTMIGIGLQGAYAGGFGLSATVKPTIVRSVLDTHFGVSWLTRLIMLLLAAVYLNTLRQSRTVALPLGVVPRVVAGIVGLAIVVPTAASGHGVSGTMVPLTLTSTVAHLVAIGTWVGGLVLVGFALLPHTTETQQADAERVVGRFSQAAFVSVIVIGITGVIQGWRLVGSWQALTSTTYGMLLCIKVVIFLAMVAIAAQSRKWVQNRSADAPRSIAVLRKRVRAEALLAVAVLLVTAILVNAKPGVDEAVNPFSAQLVSTNVIYLVDVNPPKEGPTLMHFYAYDQNGAAVEVADFSVHLSLPSKDIGPLDVPLVKTGVGHYSSESFSFPLSGRWQMDVSSRTSAVDAVTLSTDVTVK